MRCRRGLCTEGLCSLSPVLGRHPLGWAPGAWGCRRPDFPACRLSAAGPSGRSLASRRCSLVRTLHRWPSAGLGSESGASGLTPRVDSALPWSRDRAGLGHGHHCSLGLTGEDDLDALKAKNIKQTELVADLREAILRVARHFQCTDPKNCSVVSLRSRAVHTAQVGALALFQALPRGGLFCPTPPAGAEPGLQHGEPPEGPRELRGMLAQPPAPGQGPTGLRAPR